METDQQPAPGLRKVAAIAETLAALALTVAAGLTLALLVLPTMHRVELELLHGDGEPWSHERLAAVADERGLGDRPRVELVGGAERLVVDGVTEPIRVGDALVDLATEAGYARGRPDPIEMFDIVGVFDDRLRTMLVLGSQSAVFILAGVILIRRRLGNDEAPPPKPLAVAVAWGIGGSLVAVPVALGLARFQTWIGLPPEEQEWIVEVLADPAKLSTVAPFLILLLPIGEEVFFRGYMFRFLARRVSFPVGFLLSAVAFALVHANATGFLMYLALGAIFAVTQARTGRLLAPIVAHVLYNAVVLLLL